MKWMKTADKLPEKDGAYMFTDGEISVFGTYSTLEKQWKSCDNRKMSEILWWKDIPAELFPSVRSLKVRGDIDTMGKYLYETDPVEEKSLVRCAMCSRPLEEGDEYFSVLDKSIHLDCGAKRFPDFLSLLRIPVEGFS